MSVERDTFPGLLASGAKVAGHVDSSYWLDLGTPAAFVQGSADLVRGIAPTYALAAEPGEKLVLDGATVDATASLTGGTTIGAGASVGAASRVDSSVVFDGASIGADVLIERCIIGRDATIGDGAVLADAVIGDRAGDRRQLRADQGRAGLARRRAPRGGRQVQRRRVRGR